MERKNGKISVGFSCQMADLIWPNLWSTSYTGPPWNKQQPVLILTWICNLRDCILLVYIRCRTLQEAWMTAWSMCRFPLLPAPSSWTHWHLHHQHCNISTWLVFLILMSIVYQCPICPKECKSSHGLTQHFSSFHHRESQAPRQNQPTKGGLTHILQVKPFPILINMSDSRIAQLFHAARMAIIYNQILLHQIVNLLTRHPIMHSILSWIDLPLSSWITTSLDKNLRNYLSMKPYSSGRRNLPKMAATTYPGNLLWRCSTLSIWFNKAITLGRVCHSVTAALCPKRRRSGWPRNMRSSHAI